MKALVDSDVLIAVMDGGEAQSAASKNLLDAATQGAFTVLITPLIAANIMYALRRKWRTTRPRTWEQDINDVMVAMLSAVRMIPVDERTSWQAWPVGSRIRRMASSTSRRFAMAEWMRSSPVM